MRFLLAPALALALAFPAAAQKRLTPVPPPPRLLAGHEANLRLVFAEAYAPKVILRAVVRPSFRTEYAVGLRRAGGGGFEIFALRPARQVWTYAAIGFMQKGQMGAMRVDGLLDDDELLNDPSPTPAADERKTDRRKTDRRKRGRGGSDSHGISADVLEDLADSFEERPGDPTFRDVTDEKIARMKEGLPDNPADLPLTRCAVRVDDPIAAALIGGWRRMLADVGPDPWDAGLDGTSYGFAMALEGRVLEGETWSPRAGTRPATLAALAETMLEHCQAPDPARLARIGKLARRLAGGSSGRP